MAAVSHEIRAPVEIQFTKTWFNLPFSMLNMLRSGLIVFSFRYENVRKNTTKIILVFCTIYNLEETKRTKMWRILLILLVGARVVFRTDIVFVWGRNCR